MQVTQPLPINQKITLTKIERAKGIAKVVTSVEEVKEIIERLDAKYKKKRTVREMVQASIDAPVEECERAAREFRELTQKKEVTHK